MNNRLILLKAPKRPANVTMSHRGKEKGEKKGEGGGGVTPCRETPKARGGEGEKEARSIFDNLGGGKKKFARRP